MPGYNLEDLEVLVVDDNRHMRSLFRDLLRAIGAGSVLEANDGTSAFALLRKHEPDLVITDLMMQPIDGLQFTRMVRNERRSPQPYVPIVMITGFADKARVEEARDAGVTEFLAKPVTSEALYARIETIIERPRPFIRTKDFFGPDRRRRKVKGPVTGGRRVEDDHPDTPGGKPTGPQPAASPDTVGT
ncbi:MAG: response regulator [Alphaproteobacteria bacterium]|jgi:two-component system chemotaxis response regulator CheY